MIHFPQQFSFEARFLVALAITVVVETAVIVGLVRLLCKEPSTRPHLARCLFAGFFASFATLPYLWFVLPVFVRPYGVLVGAGETGVVLIEAVAYVFLLNLPFRTTIVLSLCANLASIAVGFLVVPPF
jgi:hypothetical protein